MSGRGLEMRRRAISNPQCRRIMPLQHEARDLHFFISHTKHSRVYYISTFYFIPNSLLLSHLKFKIEWFQLFLILMAKQFIISLPKKSFPNKS